MTMRIAQKLCNFQLSYVCSYFLRGLSVPGYFCYFGPSRVSYFLCGQDLLQTFGPRARIGFFCAQNICILKLFLEVLGGDCFLIISKLFKCYLGNRLKNGESLSKVCTTTSDAAGPNKESQLHLQCMHEY
jgi:hypothetical protein